MPGCRFVEAATWLVFDADLAALHHFDAVFAGVVEDYSFARLGLFGDLGVRFAHVLGGRALWAGEQMGALNVALRVVADLVELAVEKDQGVFVGLCLSHNSLSLTSVACDDNG